MDNNKYKILNLELEGYKGYIEIKKILTILCEEHQNNKFLKKELDKVNKNIRFIDNMSKK